MHCYGAEKGPLVRLEAKDEVRLAGSGGTDRACKMPLSMCLCCGGAVRVRIAAPCVERVMTITTKDIERSATMMRDLVDVLSGKLQAEFVQRGGSEKSLLTYAPLFVTGTGTDVGKTYVTALLIRALREVVGAQETIGYYKIAISGAPNLEVSDAGYVYDHAQLAQHQKLSSTSSYLFAEPVSPHLAAKHTDTLIKVDVIAHDMMEVMFNHHLTVMEGSGGIFCPLSWPVVEPLKDKKQVVAVAALGQRQVAFNEQGEPEQMMVQDWMQAAGKAFALRVIVVADAGLGVINDVLTTLISMQVYGYKPEQMRVILNNFRDEPMYHDNLAMIEAMSNGVPVIATVAEGGQQLQWYKERQQHCLLRTV